MFFGDPCQMSMSNIKHTRVKMLEIFLWMPQRIEGRKFKI